jgi:lysozyme
MKIKHFLLLILGFTLLCSCNTKPPKETNPNNKKEVLKSLKITEAPFVYGIDISSYQGNEIEVINAHQNSLGFVICKATQGAYGTDPKFQENWSKIKTDGFIRGAYHFYVSKDNPEAQATHFANTVKSMDSTDLPPVVDFEIGGIDQKTPVLEVSEGLVRFIHTAEQLLGRKLMIYTDIPTADKYLRDEQFTDYALWIANYVNKPQPDLPITWKNNGWMFWQRNANYKIENFTDDSDVFNGDMTKLNEFIRTY